jgi:hypothetical protein
LAPSDDHENGEVREGQLRILSLCPLMVHPIDEDLSMGTPAKTRGQSG